MHENIIRIGTRGSKLALWQTNSVMKGLLSQYPEIRFQIKEIKTTGDRVQNRPIFQAKTVGLFVKELEAALLDGEIDLAVHSLKDLPSKTTPGLTIIAVTEREDPRDALVSRLGKTLNDLPNGVRIGTSSRRRAAQLLSVRPDFEILDIRGNVDTRLKKAEQAPYDAIVLAMAGLIRLGKQDLVTQVFAPELMLPAAGQGVLALEIRADDEYIQKHLASIDHAESRAAINSERTFMATIGAGCHVPVGAYAQVEEGHIWLRALVASLDGKTIIRGERRGTINHSTKLGQDLAEEFLSKGASKLLASDN